MSAQACAVCGAQNPAGARFCGNCGSPLESRPVEGERRFATVLFADVVGSTAIAEQLDPEAWTQIINGAFAFMNAAVAQFGGTVSRLMGDAVLALFGAPVAHEDDPERAVRAALGMRAAAAGYAETVRAAHGVDFALRVGINTGLAVLAVVGDAVRSEYTALGDVANVAARLQSSAAPGMIVISADTQKLVHAVFELEARGPVSMKGRKEPVECFEVLGVRSVPGHSRGLVGLSSPLVGRDRELAVLLDRLADLERGVGAVVALVGEAGIGKSRLLGELREEARRRRLVWLAAHAISYGTTIPYHPWAQLGLQIVGAAEGDRAGVVRARLDGFVERLHLPAAGLPFYRTMLAVDDAADRATLAALTGSAIVEGVAAAVAEAIRAATTSPAGTGPQVLAFEDLHWADSASLELLAQVATLATTLPLLVVCVMRADRAAPSWQLLERLQGSLGSTFTRVDLEPLDAGAARHLLGNLLAIEDLPATMRETILARSEGNPFYLEEVLRALIDGGQVVRTDGHWRATSEIVTATIPQTLSGVLSARIDRLPAVTKQVAQTAAVIGRVFQHRVLEGVCRTAPPAERVDHLEPHIATLSWEQLVSESAREPEREYTFKHALTRDAAYQLLLRSRRRSLHARCGEVLEELFPERSEELAAVLAHHYVEAGNVDKALHHLGVAAEKARRLYALTEEHEHLETMLALLDQTPTAPPGVVIDAVLEWTLVRHRLNRYVGVLDRLAAAVALAREAGDERRLARALSWTGNIHMVTGFPSFGVEHLMESQKLAEKLGEESLLMLPLFATTWTLVDRDPRAAIPALEEVIESAHRVGAADVEGHAVGYLAIAYTRIGRFAEARRQIERALEIAPHATSPVKVADIHIAVGQAFREMGELDKGLEHARIGAEGAFAVSGLECACAGYLEVGKVEHDLRQPDAAIAHLDQSLQLADRVYLGNLGMFGTLIRAERAAVDFEQGQADAVVQLERSLGEARSAKDDFAAATIALDLARALLALGRAPEAGRTLAEVIPYFRALGVQPLLAESLELGAQADGAAGAAEVAAREQAEAAAIRAALQEAPASAPPRAPAAAGEPS